MHNYNYIYTSDIQGLVWGEPELAHEYDFDVENITKNFLSPYLMLALVNNMEECNFCSPSL